MFVEKVNVQNSFAIILLIHTGLRTMSMGIIFNLCSSFQKWCVQFVCLSFLQAKLLKLCKKSSNNFGWFYTFMSEKFYNNVLHNMRVNLLLTHCNANWIAEWLDMTSHLSPSVRVSSQHLRGHTKDIPLHIWFCLVFTIKQIGRRSGSELISSYFFLRIFFFILSFSYYCSMN